MRPQQPKKVPECGTCTHNLIHVKKVNGIRLGLLQIEAGYQNLHKEKKRTWREAASLPLEGSVKQ